MNEIKLGKYRHFKGNEYLVLCTAKHSETGEEMVVYRALYGEGGVWVRPASMWNEMVEKDGKMVPRFEYIEVEVNYKNGDHVLLKSGQEADIIEVLGSLCILNVYTENGVEMQTLDRSGLERRL